MTPTDLKKKVITTIVLKLMQLGHEVTFCDPITRGPLITTYRFAPKAALKVSQICGLSQDIALALGAEDVVIRRLPGEAVIGISVPNVERTLVHWRNTLERSDAILPLNLGVDQHGNLFRADLTTLPHLLIAGSTGSGKSTLLNSMLASLCYWRSADEVKLVLSDTKQVEFSIFDPMPHLLYPRATTKYQTWEYMDTLIQETEKRLETIAKTGFKNISEYNRKFLHSNPKYTLPYIILVIDELYDILGGEARGESKVANAKLQTIVGRSRASGIHVIAATQRSSVDVVKGTAKSNFPARISFRLPSEADSRTILGQSGAEHLITCGDMWFLSPSHPALIRLHSAIADQNDIRACLDLSQMRSVIKTQSENKRLTQ